MAAVDTSRALQAVFGRSYFPRLHVQTAFSLRGTGATPGGTHLGGGVGLDFDTPNWAVGLTATFPLFDWFSVRERTRIASNRWTNAGRASGARVMVLI